MPPREPAPDADADRVQIDFDDPLDAVRILDIAHDGLQVGCSRGLEASPPTDVACVGRDELREPVARTFLATWMHAWQHGDVDTMSELATPASDGAFLASTYTVMPEELLCEDFDAVTHELACRVYVEEGLPSPDGPVGDEPPGGFGVEIRLSTSTSHQFGWNL